MGKRMNNGPGSLAVGLSDPGMTALHKVGLAGLYMTLSALEKDAAAIKRRPAGANWRLSDRSIALQCGPDPKAFFDWLIKESFTIDKNGLAGFAASRNAGCSGQEAALRNELLLGIHFQVPTTSGRGGMQSRNFGTDDAPLVLRYPAFTWLAHQRAAPNEQNEVKGWLMPGASQRHSGHAGTCLAEPLSRFLCLLFLPVGAVYFRVKQKHVRPKDKRKPQTGVPRCALVAPEFNRLDAYARLRGSFYRSGVAELTVSGTAEAAWRVAALAHLEDLVREDLGVFRCRAYAFGNSPGTRQVTRIGLVVVQNPDSAELLVYSMARQFFPGQWRKAQDGTSYWVAPQIPELVAENLTVHQPWWAGFADFMADRVRRDWILGIVRDGRGRLIKMVKGEKGGLAEMVTQQMTATAETTFVQACHAAWRRRMAQIGDKARREGSSFRDQVQREYIRLYMLFTRCKNAATLREAVIAFWARGGSSLAPLQSNWPGVFALMDERGNWRKAKDLALLALASYKATGEDEAEALETEGTITEEETQG